jgi:lipoprotein-anchoring transpeptidase ErfK/SrfK
MVKWIFSKLPLSQSAAEWMTGGLGVAAVTLMTVGGWSALNGIPAQPQAAYAQADWISAWIDDLSQSSERWILVDLSDQRLMAWEGGSPIYTVFVSTGDSEDPTPTGVYSIQSMYETARMQGQDYDISDVPYVMYYSGSYAIHGAYWHNAFGVPVSHGCVNVAVDHAHWLYDWASVGTPVIVRE